MAPMIVPTKDPGLASQIPPKDHGLASQIFAPKGCHLVQAMVAVMALEMGYLMVRPMDCGYVMAYLMEYQTVYLRVSRTVDIGKV